MQHLPGTKVAANCGAIVVLCALVMLFFSHAAFDASADSAAPGAPAADTSESEIEDGPLVLSVYVADSEVALSEESESEVEDDDAGGDITVLKSSTIVLNPEALAAINPHHFEVAAMPIVRMELFDDLIVDVKFVKAKPRWKASLPLPVGEGGGEGVEENYGVVEDGFLIRGKILEPHSGFVVLRVRSNGLFGSISVDGYDRIELWRVDAPVHTAHMIEYPESCTGVVVDDMVDQVMETMGMTSGFGEDSGTMPTGCPGGCDDGCIIDVLILYTENARAFFAARSQDIEDVIQVQVEAANGILSQSQIADDLLRIVYIGKLFDDEGNDYDETGIGFIEILSDFSSLKNVQRLRDTLRADLVQLRVHNCCGGASVALLTNNLSLTMEDRGFSAVQASHGPQTVAHEFGHNFGCHHDRYEGCNVCVAAHGCAEFCLDPPDPCEHPCCVNCCDGGCTCVPDGTCQSPCEADCLCDPGTFYDFSVGWQFEVLEGPRPGKYSTIMSRNVPCCFGSTRIDYFSNPDVTYEGVPTGNACDNPEECCSAELAPANNALTIRGDEDHYGFRFLVARYRTSHNTTDTAIMVRAVIDEPPDFDETTLNDANLSPAISGNGRWTLSSSKSDNVPGFSNPSGKENIYHYNREVGILKLISANRAEEGLSANGDSFHPTMSGSGGAGAFTSNATNLVSGQVSGQQIYATQPMEVASRASDTSTGAGAIAQGLCDNAAINGDGTQIAFEASEGADNIVPQSFTVQQIIVRNRDTTKTASEFKETHLLSVDAEGDPADRDCFAPDVSETGQFVTMHSRCQNCDPTLEPMPGSSENYEHVYWIDRDHNEPPSGIFDQDVAMMRFPIAWNEGPENFPNGDTRNASISGDGSLVAAQTKATNIIDSSLNITLDTEVWDVVVIDTVTGANVIISLRHQGDQSSNGDSVNPRISRDGKYVVFESDGTNLVEGIQGQKSRIYVADISDLSNPQIVLVIDADDILEYSDGACVLPTISDNGRYIAFQFNPDSGPSQIYLYDRGSKGDLNGDGKVDLEDWEILLFNWGECPCCAADLNGDGVVDETDELCVIQNWDTCFADIGGPDGHPDGVVDGFDLLDLLSAWGPCTDFCCPADLAGAPSSGGGPDGVVNGFDNLALLSAWGPCSGGGGGSVPAKIQDCYNRYSSDIPMMIECVEWVMEYDDFFPE